MAINKITPRALDKATDYKLVPATAFIDAVNVVFGEDESNEGDSGGDAGVIKNLRGNAALSYHRPQDAIAPGDFKIIGSTTDHKLKLVYFYVYHENLNEQGIWVYDPYGKLALPTVYAKRYFGLQGIEWPELQDVDHYKENTIKCVVRGDFFNFKQNSVVQGNVVYNNTLNVPEGLAPGLLGNPSPYTIKSSDREVFEKDFYLYFTDNVNEPKKICVSGSLFATALKTEPIEVGGINPELAPLDLNQNGVIDEEDLAIFLEIFGQITVGAGPQLVTVNNEASPYFGNSYFIQDPDIFDINGDGSVTAQDNNAFLTAFGQPTQPAQTVSGHPRAFTSYEGGLFRIPEPTDTEAEKIIYSHACKPTPLVRPTFRFLQSDSSSSNNFIESEGFKFAYQIQYLDGTISAISPKSELAIPTSLIYQGNTKNPNHKNYNLCRISVQNDELFASGINAHIKSIRLLAQEGEGGFRLIKEFSKEDLGFTPYVYDFKNDQIGIPISDSEENKFFDSVPQKAESQAVVDNRLMYGNYVEGLPNYGVQASLTVQYKDRPSENLGVPIEVKSSISKHKTEFAGFDQATLDQGIPEKMSGFRITIENDAFPVLEVGEYVDFNVSFLPQKNFHVYKADESYHQSTAWGVKNANGELSDNGWTTPAEAGVNSFFKTVAPVSEGYEGALYDQNSVTNLGSPQNVLSQSFSISSRNEGIASAIIQKVDYAVDQGGTGAAEVFFGTSAANPFIIPSARLDFSIKMRCKVSGNSNTLRQAFLELLDLYLGGNEQLSLQSNAYFEVVERERIVKKEWDLGLQNFQKFYEGDALSKTISLGVSQSYNEPGHLISVLPNKGEAYWGLQRCSLTANVEVEGDISGWDNTKSREFKIYLDCIPQESLELWTCVRKWMPESPWWALSPTYLENVSNGNASMDSFYAQSNYALPDYAYEAMIYPGEGNESGPNGTVWEPPNYQSVYDSLPVLLTTNPGGGVTYEHRYYWNIHSNGGGTSPNFQYTTYSSNIFTDVDGNQLDLGRGMFEQANDVTDFCYPGYLIDNGIEEVYYYGRTGFPLRSQFFISKITPQYVTDPGGSGSRYFTCAPIAQNLNFPTLSPTFPGSGIGHYYSVMDGDGGPGGTQAPDQLENGFEHQKYSFKGANPIYSGLNNGGSAFGHVTRGYKNYISRIASPLFFGPFFTGRIFTTHNPEIYLENEYGVPGDFISWRDYDYQLIHGSIFAAPGNNYQKDTNNKTGVRSMMPYIQGRYNGLIHTAGNTLSEWDRSEWYSNPGNANWEGNKKLPFSVALGQSMIEQYGLAQFVTTTSAGATNQQESSARSFKASSDHEFGIVFYDSHGRRSFVNPIGSVYVEGFSNQERGSGGKGPVRIVAILQGDPPEWASKYQLVYGGNKSTSSFIQYTTTNAFVENTLNTDVDINSGKIYVSLNGLQGSPISYSKEFGAKGEDGSTSIYKYTPGDKLRIISYGSDTAREYPNDYVFDVVEVVTLDPLSPPESNPLLPDETTLGSQYYGEFLVINNNPDADGFNYSSLLAGGSNFWRQNVAFEIFSPKKYIPSDAQVYQEIGEVYDILELPGGQRKYSTGSIIAYEGDVYFRPTAVNVNGSSFEDLFAADTDASDGNYQNVSNFQNLLLESRRPSDLTPAKLTNFGRRNVESSNARRVRREAGIIYSEKSNPESDVSKYSSFNASLFPFKDLEERFGNINFMDELGGNLLVIQQDRCTLVPVSATMLSNATGQEQLIASNAVLGKERVYSVKAGCDNNPESVVRIDTTYYFAHKSLGKVFRFVEGQGIEEISDVNMGAYFRSKFKEVIAQSGLSSKKDVRVVGGYDPVKDEYLLTILRPLTLEIASGEDAEVVYGCQDPDAINYNPNANRSDGSCEYEDSNPGDAACAEVEFPTDIDFGIIEISSTVSNNSPSVNQPITISNTGETDLIIGNIYIQNDNSDVFTASVGSYLVDPGESTNINILCSANMSGVYNATLVVEFLNSKGGCVQVSSVPLTVQVVNEIDEDPTGVITINFYVGGTLIDQQFADVSSGSWDVTIDQNRVIQSVANSYSGAGTKALVEVEVIVSDTLGALIQPGDKITVTGNIVDGIEGFEFISI